MIGSSTADTIKGGLIDVALFEPQPELLLLAMVCSLVGSSTWVLVASSRGWPVSTTMLLWMPSQVLVLLVLVPVLSIGPRLARL